MTEFVCKSSRDPEIRALYEQHEFLTAYALHTDRRVAEDPQQAIGGLWEEYGTLCRDFLIAQGLKPEHRLLDFGCGTGRLARKVVPYLDFAKYIGVDISPAALDAADRLGDAEGWLWLKDPGLMSPDLLPYCRPFDYVWCFSVFIHLPPVEVLRAFCTISDLMLADSRFYFSYVLPPGRKSVRTGLKQFKHPLSLYRRLAKKAGLVIAEPEVKGWTERQTIALARKAG